MFDRVNDAEVQRRHELAAMVHSALSKAGIPASLHPEGHHRSGAIIDVDTGSDGMGGVYVLWQFSEEMIDEMSDPLRAGDLAHPTLQLSQQITAAMQEAIITVLNAFGLNAIRWEDDTGESGVSVKRAGDLLG